MIQRAIFEATGDSKDDVQEQLKEELGSFGSRHRGRKWWHVKMEIRPSGDGYWGFIVLTRRDDAQVQGWPVRKEAVEDGSI